MEEQFALIAEKIKEAKKILLTAHVGIDGDAIGSLVGMTSYLKKEEKDFVIILEKEIPRDFSFLRGLDNTKLLSDFEKSDLADFDLLIMLDSPKEERTPLIGFFKEGAKQPPTILMDHHLVCPNNAFLKIVDDQRSSASEIIFDFLKAVKHEINKHVATALLCGLSTDTSFFNNPGTNIKSTKTASELIGLGGDYKKITKNILQNQNVNYLKFLGDTFGQIIYNEDLNFVSVIITKEDIEKFKLEEGDIKGVANFLQQNIASADRFLVIREGDDGILRGNLRSAKSNIRPLAIFFGGGGHNKASGFQIAGKIQKENGKIKII
jgi:bifunctional oligoribonuclease and PAP phosphatase NrnA